MIAIIAAVSKNKIIGKNGQIPWNIPEDKKYFKELTVNNAVIMGRRTFEEIGKPLPQRFNIIITSDKNLKIQGCYTADNVLEAIKLAQNNNYQNIFLCGGKAVYEEGLKYADKLFITEIQKEYDGDTYFPDFDETKYSKKSEKYVNGNPSFEFVTYTKLN